MNNVTITKYCASWAVKVNGGPRASIYQAISGRYVLDMYVHPKHPKHMTIYDTLTQAKAAVREAYEVTA